MDKSESPPHDLYDYMLRTTLEMAKDYELIQKRSSQGKKRSREDPGTAGDQGEENWRALFESWLPSYFRVVTKGRILSHEGEAGPQVDVLILGPSYPTKLLNQKYYLAGGVAAAFECKVTLKAHHIRGAVDRSAQIKRLVSAQQGSPYLEIQSPLIYGLLAHSHCWKSRKSSPVKNIGSQLLLSDRELVKHPREMLDFLCISDLSTWVGAKLTYIGPPSWKNWETMKAHYGPDPCAITSYIEHSAAYQHQEKCFTPIGTLLTSLFEKLAGQFPEMRRLSRYLRVTKIGGAGAGSTRKWPLDIYSEKTRKELDCGAMKSGIESEWSEWASWF